MSSDLKGVTKEWADGGEADESTQWLSRGPEAGDNCPVVHMALNRTSTSGSIQISHSKMMSLNELSHFK